ncbi:hypothetical protein [Kribbella italica]|uniref:Uncharacterized protein n=1 Tax=Kribbella italica TaxID=1540520 RepID=A0A7W9JG95_9ACTN|nr:hypothetical protein [Kribbella italica]
MRDPNGDAVTDPRRVRVSVGSPHPREVAAVAGGHFGGQVTDEGYVGRVAILVELMGVSAKLRRHVNIFHGRVGAATSPSMVRSRLSSGCRGRFGRRLCFAGEGAVGVVELAIFQAVPELSELAVEEVPEG